MELENINKKTYSTPKALEVYTASYLWTYEEVLFSQYIKPGMRVLDVGCGVGRLAKFWAEAKVEVVGIDMVEQFIDEAKKLYQGSDFRVMNATKLDFPSQSFDLVFFSNQGIDYTDRRQEVIAEAYRVLKPGGLFVYTSHNSLSLPRTKKGWKNFLVNLKFWRPGLHYRIEHHPNGDFYVAHNNIWSEQKVLRKVGFKVLEVWANSKHPGLPSLVVGLFVRWPMYICRKPYSS